jgi:o-succinylbenzoate---CoA ligase
VDWYARAARDHPRAPFLIEGDDVVDHATAWERISGMAGGITADRSRGALVGVVMRPTVDRLLFALAAQVAGMVLVPLPSAATDADRRRLVSLGGEVIEPEDVSHAPWAPQAPDDRDTAAMISTSGSSGEPRAVRLTWGNLEASAAASASHLDHRRDDRWLAVLPFHHVGGLSILWRSARQGSAVVLAAPFDASRSNSLLHAGAATLGSFVSPMLEALVDAGLERAPGFRFGLVGGGPASARGLAAGGMRLLPSYGMTETASQVATADPAAPRPDRLVVLRGAEIGVRPDGRIVVEGPMVSPGDAGGPDRRGPLVTGDIGRMHGDLLEVLGRADEVIVTGGENVMPERVERALAAIPGAGRAAVVGVPDDRWGMVVAACYTGPATADDLDRAARSLVASHEVPRRWKRVDAIPELGIGKVDRRAVAALFD